MNIFLKKKTKNACAVRSMSSLPCVSVIGSAEPDSLKIKVYKPSENSIKEGYEPGESKKFCIDPRLASYRTIQCLIAQAYDIQTDFIVYAVHRCSDTRLEKLTAIWSDFELEQAIRSVESDSYLRLSYELTPREDCLDDWDVVAINDYSTNIRWINVDERSIIATVKSPTGKKISTLNKAISWMYGGHERDSVKPIDEYDYRKFMDSEGRLINTNELRLAIYQGGIEPSIRRLVWRHLLNIFPSNMTSSERHEYIKDVSIKYEKLKGRWKDEQQNNETIRKTMRAVHTDVIRTDRTFGFYSSSTENDVNLQSLYNILMTYCANHPNTPYCQGMNEYASTVLYVMRDESVAYLCFCSIMRRIRANFATDGIAMATKFHHLKFLLRAIDPVYWNFFESCDAVSLFFTYRWLLLECKREFPFNDALHVLEVMWATLPIASEPPPLSEIPLLPISTNPVTPNVRFPIACRRVRPLQRRALSCPQFSFIDQSSSESNRIHSSSVVPYDNRNSEQLSSSLQPDYYPTINNGEYEVYKSNNKTHDNNSSNSTSTKSREKTLENSFSLSEISDFDSNSLSATSNNPLKTSSNSSQYTTSIDWVERLPTDYRMWLEEDNIFLLFLCISILLTHRSHLLKQKDIDEQEISMHFDRHRRRHHAARLLKYARTLYSQYIQWTRKQRMLDDLNKFSIS